MTIGQVLAKERERKGMACEQVAIGLNLTPPEYRDMEAGSPDLERWALLLAEIAIHLKVPTSRLLAESGRGADAVAGQVGKRIAHFCSLRDLSPATLTLAVGCTPEEWKQIEAGESPLEYFGPKLLCFAELMDLPVFNLFYPCGLPAKTLQDYP